MWLEPQLIIGYAEDGTPAEAACSRCGARMLKNEPLPSDASAAIKAFTDAFHKHVREEHPAFTPN